MAARQELSCLADFEEFVKKKWGLITWEYYSRGAEGESTLDENTQAFKRLKFRPRMLRGITDVDLSTTILGQPVSMPICISPTATHKLAHPDGEVATAKGCAKSGSLMAHSFFTTSTINDVLTSLDQSPLLQTLYLRNQDKSRTFTQKLMEKAEKLGVRGFILTVDEPVRGIRRWESTSSQYFDLLQSLNAVCYLAEELLSEGGEGDGFEDIGNGLTWEIIPWLKSLTKLPIVVKGILTAEDAKLAVQHGADAIIVSNHGGRQLDGVLATIDALPEVVSAVNGQVEVYMDGGVRLGTDVLKALTLGARAVFIGRPIIWGLAHEGSEGVYKVLEILRTELKTATILSGNSNSTYLNRTLPQSLARLRSSRIETVTAEFPNAFLGLGTAVQ